MPEATPPLFGASTGNFLDFRAAIVAFSASRSFAMASSMLSPSEMHSAKSGNEMSRTDTAGHASGVADRADSKAFCRARLGLALDYADGARPFCASSLRKELGATR